MFWLNFLWLHFSLPSQSCPSSLHLFYIFPLNYFLLLSLNLTINLLIIFTPSLPPYPPEAFPLGVSHSLPLSLCINFATTFSFSFWPLKHETSKISLIIEFIEISIIASGIIRWSNFSIFIIIKILIFISYTYYQSDFSIPLVLSHSISLSLSL